MQAVKTYTQARNLIKFMKYNSYFTRFSAVVPLVTDRRKIKVENSVSEVYRLGFSFYSTTAPQNDTVDHTTFEKACDETLESLTEYFEQIVEESDNLKSADVSYSTGVLTVNLGPQYGTYVINRQSPNRQIWLSSPISGPKRYDFVVKDNCWVYKHDGQSLHRLLQDEISKIAKTEVDFANCSYSKL